MLTLEKGQKVITRSNDYEEPAQIGTFIDWTEIKGSEFPLVEIDGVAYIMMAIMLPYHEGLLQFLNSMSPKEAYELARDISITIQVVHRRANQCKISEEDDK